MPKKIAVEITPMAFAEIRLQLQRAGADDSGVVGDTIDLANLFVLKAREHASNTNIEIGSLLGTKTRAGAVELCVNGERTQMDLDKAREVLGMLSGAIEAAVSDQLLFQFLTTKVGLPEEAAGRALIDFRELRQGSRNTVRPS